jgi:hypothetical protein
MGSFSSFSELQKLKIHIFKKCWDIMGCTKRLKDLSEGDRENIGDMERYWDITEGVRDIMGNKERDWAMTDFLGLIMRRQICGGASPRSPGPSWGSRWGT